MLKFVYDIDSCPCSKVHISLRKIKSHGTEKSCVNIPTPKCKVTQEIFSSYSKINSSLIHFYSIRDCGQCGFMNRLFGPYLANYNNTKLPNSIKKLSK